MIAQVKADMIRYFISAFVIAVLWFIASFVFSLMLAAADDNPNMSATTPWPLKWAYAITSFPMSYLQGWDRSSDHAGTASIIVGMLMNALFWGILIVILYRLAVRYLVTK